MDDTNFPLHQHCAAQVQYLHVNLADQEREGFEQMSLRYDGWSGLDQR
jgi:hypothetical protein